MKKKLSAVLAENKLFKAAEKKAKQSELKSLRAAEKKAKNGNESKRVKSAWQKPEKESGKKAAAAKKKTTSRDELERKLDCVGGKKCRKNDTKPANAKVKNEKLEQVLNHQGHLGLLLDTLAAE